jgi:Skp family chaperone for outer membrane proteins
MKFLQLFLVSSFVFVNLTANAQKTAFINESKVLEKLPGYAKAMKETDSIKKLFVLEIEESTKKLNTKISALIQNYSIKNNETLEEIKNKLTVSDKNKFELFQEEAKLLEKQSLNKNEEYEALYKSKVAVLLDKVNKVTSEYCKQNKIDALFKLDVMNPALAFYNEKNDVTNQIITLITK